MASFFKSLFTRLTGGGDSAAGADEGVGDPVDYKGYSIRPAPYQSNGQYQVAGIIEKTIDDTVRQHRFIRADTSSSHEAAASFAIAKAQQLIDEQGDRIFDETGSGSRSGSSGT